jgi:hypothetical protein
MAYVTGVGVTRDCNECYTVVRLYSTQVTANRAEQVTAPGVNIAQAQVKHLYE